MKELTIREMRANMGRLDELVAAKAAVVQSLRLTGAGQTYRVVRRERGAYSVLVGEETQPRIKGRDCTPERSIALSAEAIAALGTDGPPAQDISLAIRRELEQIAYLGAAGCQPSVWLFSGHENLYFNF